MNKGKEGRHSGIFDSPEFLTAMLIMAVETDDEEKDSWDHGEDHERDAE